jgi:(1->4)-alpha-D-glucan 1-alpha-D-glucosylmutase
MLEAVAFLGMLNSLSATLIKLTAPGVPDIYQGNELPQLVLVDPDNRRMPDLNAHAAQLEAIVHELEKSSLDDVVRLLRDSWRDGRLKLFLTWRLLRLRVANPRLLEEGAYLPLSVEGERASHLCAFARSVAGCTLISIAARWMGRLVPRGSCAVPGAAAWGDTRMLLPAQLPAGEYRDVLTGHVIPVGESSAGERRLLAGDLLSVLPVSVLIGGGNFPAARTATASDQ